MIKHSLSFDLEKLTWFVILFNCCQWCSKVSAKTTDSCCEYADAILFLSKFTELFLGLQIRFMTFLAKKVQICVLEMKVGVSEKTFFFEIERVFHQLCIGGHGTRLWKIVAHFFLWIFTPLFYFTKFRSLLEINVVGDEKFFLETHLICTRCQNLLWLLFQREGP